jgi:hypothetical protein
MLGASSTPASTGKSAEARGERRKIARRRAEEEGAEAFFPPRATTKSADSKRDARAAHKKGRVILTSR